MAQTSTFRFEVLSLCALNELRVALATLSCHLSCVDKLLAGRRNCEMTLAVLDVVQSSGMLCLTSWMSVRTVTREATQFGLHTLESACHKYRVHAELSRQHALRLIRRDPWTPDDPFCAIQGCSRRTGVFIPRMAIVVASQGRQSELSIPRFPRSDPQCTVEAYLRSVLQIRRLSPRIMVVCSSACWVEACRLKHILSTRRLGGDRFDYVCVILAVAENVVETEI